MSEYFTPFEGIVLTKRQYREHDALVKIFTSEYGKRMFFIRGLSKQPNHPLKSSLNPVVHSQFLGRINPSGLSFLKDASVQNSRLKLQNDPINYAYAIYFMALIDAAFEDGEVQRELFDVLVQVMNHLEKGLSPNALQILLETHVLPFFGVDPDWMTCQITGKNAFHEPCYFSYQPYGVILVEAYNHLRQTHKSVPGLLSTSPQAVALCQRMRLITPNKLGQMNIKDETFQAAKQLLHNLYKDYAGIHLKSWDYLEDMLKWFK
ncbi:DNA repair protein RecO [Atopobacter phocae]|uniref:DNA repair protein RecO n=1 Tax=Atopobacter phocae TaxID=136492 RepID=UPI0004710EB5|nr:DNA repair protein RecO [Atopobacter phocae]